MDYYNDINNVQNERVKLALKELIEGLGLTNNYVATFNEHNIEILMAYIIHLEEKVDNLLRDKLNNKSNLIKSNPPKGPTPIILHEDLSIHKELQLKKQAEKTDLYTR